MLYDYCIVKTTSKQTLGIFWNHTKKYKLQLFIILIGMGVVIVSDIVQPFFYRDLVNFVSEGDSRNVGYALRLVLYITAMAVLYNVGWRSVVAATNVLQGKTKRDLYQTCYNYVLNHSQDFFNNNFVGGLVSKIGRFDRAYENIADEFIFGAGRTIVLLIAIFVTLAYTIPLAAMIIAVWVLVYLVVTYKLNQYRFKHDLAAAEQDTHATGHVADTIANVTTIKLFASEPREQKEFGKIAHEQYLRRRKSWDISNYIDMVQGGLMILLEFGLMYAAVILWQQSKISVGDFILLQSYMLSIFHHLWNIGRNLRYLYQSMADANEMTEILSTAHEIADVPNAKRLSVGSGAIQFIDVGFQYKNNRRIFSNFQLDVAGGERVALVGPSGGGKSTIVKLIFRFFDLNKGRIVIDGQDISQVTSASLRSQISLVPQDPILFHRSILENIRYAKPNATKAEVIAAAKAANCHGFITALPDKYETLVGERGVKLSGGERQRVAIARAILKNSPILILDEATSSLDSESENLIQGALKNLMKGRTTIVIAHRLSTIMAMDRIVVIEKGKITEQGKHAELLKAQKGKYQKLWHIQAGSFAS